MNRTPVLFRVDGTSRTGWERLGRCVAFANALQRRRRPCHFLSQLDSLPTAAWIRKGGHEWLATDTAPGSAHDLERTLAEIKRLAPAAVVVDHPDIGPDYLAELTATGVLVVHIEHALHYCTNAHVLVNPSLGVTWEDHEVCPGTQVLCGPRYAVVRPEMRRLRSLRAQEPPGHNRVAIVLGDDARHLAGRVAQQLVKMRQVEHVDLIVYAQHEQVGAWRELMGAHLNKLDVVTDPVEAIARAARAHVAVADGNAWSLELACLGVPLVLVVEEEGYWKTAQTLEEEGAAICLGWYEDFTDSALRQTVACLLEDCRERQSMARAGRGLIDGRGLDRLVLALELMLHRAVPPPLREAA